MEPAEEVVQQVEQEEPEVKGAEPVEEEEAKTGEMTAATEKEEQEEKAAPEKKSEQTGMYVTDAMHKLELTDADKYIKIKSGDFQRLVFGKPQKLVQREIDHRKKFDKWMEDNKKSPIPADYLDDQRLWLRFLQGTGWKYEQAYDEMQVHHKWKKETYPINGKKYLKFLTSGALYISTRAKRGMQPVIVMNLKKFIDANVELADLEVIACFYFDYIINNYLLPGYVENWILIIDMKDVGITQLPVSKLKGFIK